MSEVLVYGATAAGVSAAVAAADGGARVTLLEPGHHVGGMVSGGLGYTDIGDPRVLGGPAARLRTEIARHYGVPEGRYAGPEPHVAEAIFARWLETAGVEVVFGARLEGVEIADGADGRRIAAVTCDGGRRFTPAVAIDASYEGDLLALAGVPYAVGREGVARYGESLAGRREVAPGMHNFPAWISPYAHDEEGRRPGPLLAGIKPEPMAAVGAGDGGIMSYGYRVCLTMAADRIAVEPSPGYDPDYFELARRLFAQWEREGRQVSAGQLIGLEQNLPGAKCDGNSLGPYSLSVLDGAAWLYPDADRVERERIRRHHLDHARNFLYFLTHDAGVPAHVRAEMARWGLPADEFGDTDHLPHQLYVREARRMVGEYVLTQADLLPDGPGATRRARRHADAIAMGSYHIDIREVQRACQQVYEHPDARAIVVTEGYLSVRVPPYQVPYRCLTPRFDDCANLLVAVCISASHVAFASVRMEPQYQMLGQACGRAAALALRRACPVQRVDVAALQDQLKADGQVLAL